MKRNYGVVLLVFVLFFVISFLTNILNPLIPEIKVGFNVGNAMAGFLPFAFFVAYGVMSIPSGMAIEKYQAKKVMIAAFVMSFIGAFLFALIPQYSVALISLFSIGIGMAMLQVAINPLLRVAGGEENFAFNSVFAQLVFGAASFLSPMVYSYLVTGIPGDQGNSDFLLSTLSGLVPKDLPWVSIYWIFAVISLVMFLLLMLIKLPKVELKEEEKSGTWATYQSLFKDRTVWLFFIGVFAYVGTEQGIANWISEFLKSYHGYNPQIEGANAVSLFWGLLTVGCLLGMLLLKFIDSRKVLIIFSSFAMISLSFAIFGPAEISLYAFPLTGFFLSVMWSIIISLALNSYAKHHGSFSGILVTGIVGGAVVPLIVGAIGTFSLKVGLMFLYLTLAYILSIGFWAKPLVNNKTINLRKKE